MADRRPVLFRNGTVLTMDDAHTVVEGGDVLVVDDKIAEMEKQLEEKVTGFRRFQEDAEKELGKSQEQAFADIERRVAPIIEQAGKEGGYTLMFNKYQSGLVYANEAADITNQIIQRFDAAAPAAKP